MKKYNKFEENYESHEYNPNTNGIFNFNTDFLDSQLRFAEEKEDDSIKMMIQEAITAACTVFIYGDGTQWTGSGFHIGDGIIVTAGHVCPPDTPLEISLSFDGKHLYGASLIISNPDIDVALLNCPNIINQIPNVMLSDSDKAEIGDIIATIASPEGWNDTATVGRISNIHQSLGELAPSPAWNDIIFIDADILQGASGGMVIGTDGLVVGSIMGVTGQYAELGIGQRAICPSNKINILLESL
jgi:S1-C subfamily serine protease